MVRFKAAHVVKGMILTCVRWYVAYRAHRGRLQFLELFSMPDRTSDYVKIPNPGIFGEISY